MHLQLDGLISLGSKDSDAAAPFKLGGKSFFGRVKNFVRSVISAEK
jgi:hypothetical protein